MRKRRAWTTYFALAISVILTEGVLSQDGSAPSQPDLKTLRQAADAGDSEAQTQLADTYLYGRGIEKDYGEAVRWYRRAAEMTNAPAQLQLGLLYLRGEKVQRDYGRALEWLRKAASQDVKQAQYLVSRIYKDSLGVERDIRESYAYANLAATDGGEAAAYRDNLEKSMSLSEISAGQERSRQLRKDVKPRGSQISIPLDANLGPTTGPRLADRLAKARGQSPREAGSFPGEVSFSDTSVVQSDYEKARPSTLAEARRQAELGGEKVKQERGVRHRGQLAMDAKATPFGEYDEAWIKAVQEQWYNLLDNSSLSSKSGKVILQVNLKFDGTITDLKVRLTEVGEPLASICKRAVLDPSPYARWPTEMHRMVGGNIRPVTLTFLYY